MTGVWDDHGAGAPFTGSWPGSMRWVPDSQYPEPVPLPHADHYCGVNGCAEPRVGLDPIGRVLPQPYVDAMLTVPDLTGATW